MAVQYDAEVLEQTSQKVGLIPIGIYKPRDDVKRKIYNIVKRAVDIVAGLVGVVLLVPLTIGVYIAQKILHDDGGVFYKQKRIGKDGEYFYIWKFRTMVPDADEILSQYLEENETAKKEFEENQKLKNDPRVTKLGKFLRRTSLDETPQFINLLNR